MRLVGNSSACVQNYYSAIIGKAGLISIEVKLVCCLRQTDLIDKKLLGSTTQPQKLV